MDNDESYDDNEIKTLRVLSTLLQELGILLPQVLWKYCDKPSKPHQYVRGVDLDNLINLIDPFQEDPQLLDSHLKSLLPPLVDAYLKLLPYPSRSLLRTDCIPLSHGICRILNIFCKVRGEKVIKGFLNNEPRFLASILSEIELGRNLADEDTASPSSRIVPWAERYVLFLWLTHLMLVPFPLASMSAVQASEQTSNALSLKLPDELPSLALRILTIGMKGLYTASKERQTAAKLLVKLCLRPDMQQLRLHAAVLQWALSMFEDNKEQLLDIHHHLGVLSFLSGMLSSATAQEIGPFVAMIYRVCCHVLHDAQLDSVKRSAVARKLIIKMFRSIVFHCIQAQYASHEVDSTLILEEVIGYYLEFLGDGDTQVRYASSKALGMVTIRLDSDMATEVVEAILGSLTENVFWQGSKRTLAGVNALRWHGLTLTLSHLLYRRAITSSQLPEILNALLLALAFEQRTATGGSVGTNVRDAACFGVWALARRYATDELLAVDTAMVKAAKALKSTSIIQILANELLVVACLDPAGNIRRGASAALQELIGRHPNMIHEGISLVQIVDFHAVGLRDRAMREVAVSASALCDMYWEVLFANLRGWKGTNSLDAASRLHAAHAIGLLSATCEPSSVEDMYCQISARINMLEVREVEERQGLVAALTALLYAQHKSQSSHASEQVDATSLRTISSLWQLLNKGLNLEDRCFISPAMRPDFTASSMCNFLGALANASHRTYQEEQIILPMETVTRLFDLCLGRHADAVLTIIPRATQAIMRLLQAKSPQRTDITVESWLVKLENEASYNGLRWSGFALALGAVYCISQEGTRSLSLQHPSRIIKVLTFRCSSAVAIEPRTIALRAIGVLLESLAQSHPSDLVFLMRTHLIDALQLALNDYEVTERGDVGSLVRMEALKTVRIAQRTGCFQLQACEPLYTSVLRLSLEKLDKIRQYATHIVIVWFESQVSDGVSSYAYFQNALRALATDISQSAKEAICLGYVSSAGLGSESVIQNARAAILDMIPQWTKDLNANRPPSFSLQDFAVVLLSILKSCLNAERTLLPLLEVLAFLFDMQVLQQLESTSFNFRDLLSNVQKAHFKSSHMQKLLLALDLYRGLGTLSSTRMDTLSKVASMLLHPFPTIRMAAAETLWTLTAEESLLKQDWSAAPKTLKPAVEDIKARIKK